MLIIGPTECGKSSLSVQMAVEWACAYQNAIIKACGVLRLLVVQAEDDRQDSREMARVYHKLGLRAEQIEQVKKNTRFVEWCPKGNSASNEAGESGKELTEFLEAEIKRGGSVDVIIVNPLSAYMDEGIMSQRANKGFFYNWITPFLKRQGCAIIFVHHTPKFREDAKEQHHYVQLYAGAGDATITNWPRASFFVRPKQDGFFEFVAGKRGRRIGWNEEARLFKWGEDCIFWQEASAEEKMDFCAAKAKREEIRVSALWTCLGQ
jgi:RecA-family ATPase